MGSSIQNTTQNRPFGAGQTCLLISFCHVLFFKLFFPPSGIFRWPKGHPAEGDSPQSQGGLSLSMQMSTFQRLWQQPKAALCRADIDFSSESPSLLLSRDCVCSSGHMRCPGPSSPAVLVPAVCIQPGTNPAGEILPAAGVASPGTARPLHHLAKADPRCAEHKGKVPSPQ